MEAAPDDRFARLGLAVALYATGRSEVLLEASSNFKIAIAAGAHDRDPLTMYRAAICFEDAVRVCESVRVCECVPAHARSVDACGCTAVPLLNSIASQRELHGCAGTARGRTGRIDRRCESPSNKCGCSNGSCARAVERGGVVGGRTPLANRGARPARHSLPSLGCTLLCCLLRVEVADSPFVCVCVCSGRWRRL